MITPSLHRETLPMVTYGTLVSAPTQRTTRAGRQFVMATALLDLDNTGLDEHRVDVIARGSAAATLARCCVGDCLSIDGSLKTEHWQNRRGRTGERLTLVAAEVRIDRRGEDNVAAQSDLFGPAPTHAPAGACRRCGATETVVGPGKERHAATEVCAGCGGFRRWVGKAELARTAA